MDEARDRPYGRTGEDEAEDAPSGGFSPPPRRAAFAAAAPVMADDILIDPTLRPLPAEPPHPVQEATRAPEAADEPLPPLAEPRSSGRGSAGLFVSISLGAVVAVAAMVAAALRPQEELAPAPSAQAAAQPAAALATVHLRVDAGLSPEERERIRAALGRAGYGMVMHEMPFRISRSRVGYFHEADRSSAQALIAALRGVHDGIELRDYRTIMAAPEPGRLDLWIGG